MNAVLREELLRMFDEDQAAVRALLDEADRFRERFELRQPATEAPWPYALLEWQPPDDAPDVVRRVHAVTTRNSDRLREIVGTHGWPGRSLVGEDGADAAWLLLQHSSSAVKRFGSTAAHEFRRACIALLEKAVAERDAHPRHLAATVDGVRFIDGDPPEFATLSTDFVVVDGRAVSRCAVDEQAIDARRAAIGLPPLSDDVARRARGEALVFAGPYRSEPWPRAR